MSLSRRGTEISNSDSITIYVLGRSAAAVGERRQGLLPLLLHPNPRRVAFIGLATGISASAAPALGIEDTTVVELVPEVAMAARAHFAPLERKIIGAARCTPRG